MIKATVAEPKNHGARQPGASCKAVGGAVAAQRGARSDARPRHVALLVDPGHLRRFHAEIAMRLTRDVGAHVTLMTASAASIPASVELLFKLERLSGRLAGPTLADHLDVGAPGLPTLSDGPADLVIDLCGAQQPIATRSVRLLYDGAAGEASLLGALVGGRMPLVEIQDGATGAILASGMPGADNAATILEAFDCVLARIVTLIVSTAREQTPRTRAPRQPPRAARLQDIARFEAKSLAYSVARRLYHLCCHAPHWQTYWRFVQGPGIWETRSLTGPSWRTIPDPGFRFYADPFPFFHEGRYHVFVEDLDHRLSKGIISVVAFDGDGPCGPAKPVLEEPWHLSYPFVFEHDGKVWMIPESSANRTVSLYRADPFPHRWVRECDLLTDVEASDATVIRHQGRFWMFAATRDGAGSWSDTLSLYRSDDIRGPWTAHPANPVLIDQASARPAGAIVRRSGALWRPVQDCTNGYGTGVGLAEITKLDDEGFDQIVRCVLRSPPAWPGRRFHTFNRAGNLECLDGAGHSLRSRHLSRLIVGRRQSPALQETA